MMSFLYVLMICLEKRIQRLKNPRIEKGYCQFILCSPLKEILVLRERCVERHYDTRLQMPILRNFRMVSHDPHKYILAKHPLDHKKQ